MAERLFAEHGPDGVSLRDIARAAGQRNNSAVQYHFGGRDQLVAEVFRRRMTEINAVRVARLDDAEAGPDPDLADLVTLVLEPLADHVRRAGSGSTYAQFMVRTMTTVDFRQSLLAEANEVQVRIGERMRRHLAHLDDATARRRIELGLEMAVGALAAFERRWNIGAVDEGDLPETVAEIVAMTAAGLQAPDVSSAR